MARRPSLCEAIVAAWLIALCGCKASCSLGGTDAESLAKEIAQGLTAQTGVDIKITCPEDIDGEKVTECMGTAPGGVVFIAKVTKDTDGKMAWTSQGLVVGKKLEKELRDMYAAQYQLMLDDLQCPPVASGQKGVHLECKARPQGVEVIVEVLVDELVEENGKMNGKLKRGVVLASAAADAAVREFEKAGMTATVDCGTWIRPSVPGSTFECAAKDASGQNITVYFKVTDDDGGVTFRTTPFE